jgi:methyl-accepting chemotaxis protein
MADAIAIDLVKLRAESARLIANADDPGAAVNSKINVEQLKNEVEKYFSDYIARVAAGTEHDSIVALQDAYKAFIPALYEQMTLIEQHKLDDARMLANTTLSLQGDLMDMQVQLLRELNKQSAATAVGLAPECEHHPPGASGIAYRQYHCRWRPQPAANSRRQ